MPREVDKLQQITGYSKDYDTSQKILSKRHRGNDKHLTQDNAVRIFEKINGYSPNTFMSLQEGYFARLEGDPHLLFDGDFEKGGPGSPSWYISSAYLTNTASAVIVSNSSFSGNKCLYTVTSNTSQWVSVNSEYIPVTPGGRYLIEAYWAANSVNQAHFKIRHFATNSNSGATAGGDYQIMPGTDGTWGWTYISGVATIPLTTNAKFIHIACMGGNASAMAGAVSGETWFDKVKITPLNHYPTMTTEAGWLETALVGVSAEPRLFGSWRCSFENDLVASNGVSATTILARNPSTATVINSQGKIEVINDTSPRYENSKFDQGLWIELAKTNGLLNSGFESNTVSNSASDNWAYYSNGAVATATYSIVTSDYMAGSKCLQITTPTSSANFWGISQVSIPSQQVAANSPMTVSIYARAVSGTASLAFLQDHGAYTYSGTLGTLSSTWSRFQTSVTSVSASANGTFYIRTPSRGASFLIDAVQFENGEYASTYIPTTTASGTRGTEAYTFPTPSMIGPTRGSFSTWIRPNWNGGDGSHGNPLNTIFRSFTNSPTSGDFFVFRDVPTSTLQFIIRDSQYNTKGVSASIAAGSVTRDTWFHLGGTWDNGTLAMYFNGASAGAVFGNGSGIMGTIGSGLHVGISSPNNNKLDGLLDDLAFFDRPLTAAEMWNLYTKGN